MKAQECNLFPEISTMLYKLHISVNILSLRELVCALESCVWNFCLRLVARFRVLSVASSGPLPWFS